MLSSLRTAVCMALMIAGWAATAQAQTTASHLTIKGSAVTATFISLDPANPCIETAVNVISSHEMQKISPGSKKTTTIAVDLLITRIDQCTGVPLFVGIGSAAGDDVNLEIAGDLRTATLAATGHVVDEESNTHHFAVNLTWTAIGEAVRNHEHELFRDEDLGLFINSQVRGQLVPAVATGTVTGLGENWTPEPSTSAEILTQSAGIVVIGEL
jgi:hypothetical protein